MATEHTEAQSNVTDPFAYLYSYEFVVLTTFRKDGREVPTTVWFAHENGKIYITTSTSTGKIKRVRNISRVFLAPSDRVGNVLGERIEGRAREIPQSEHEHARQLLAAKYPNFAQITGQRGGEDAIRTYIEVSPNA